MVLSWATLSSVLAGVGLTGLAIVGGRRFRPPDSALALRYAGLVVVLLLGYLTVASRSVRASPVLLGIAIGSVGAILLNKLRPAATE